MASNGAAAAASHPSPPPSQSQPPSQQPNLISTTAPPSSTPLPPTSLTDSGHTKRPRDARIIHMILTSLGVSAYQERVPLQLLDFAYRYTSGILTDALHLSAEGLAGGAGTGDGSSSTTAAGGGSSNTNKINLADLSSVNLQALRLAVFSRTQYQFSAGLPKEFLLELAQERNRVMLPKVERDYGVRLPPERYCLTGVGFHLKEEWESEGEDDGGEDGDEMGGEDAGDMNAEEEGEGDELMEDVFGTSFVSEGGGAGGGGGDSEMADA
ncbi:MAG: Transcription initiation factor TFIID subunit 9 [Cirrosporium novae-zelandiae]|nr:MAG: Transcription initiation factor TFIID subunit 9 [Cirrosporium novae-zelandiae]